MDATNGGQAQLCNGFYGKTEPIAFRIESRNVSPYSLPQEALDFEPDAQDVVYKFKNGDSERKIHGCIELSEDEKFDLQAMRDLAVEQNLRFYHSIILMATRFNSRARRNTKKAVELMQATQGWREEFFQAGPVCCSQLTEDFTHGIMYWTGRDYALRPTLVIRAKRIPPEWLNAENLNRALHMVIFSLEYFMRYMCVPGKIENNNIIVDLDGIGATQVPIGLLKQVYSVCSHHYVGRVFKFYVMNMSWGLSAISGVVKALLTDRQKQKLEFVSDVKDLRKAFALHQLEKDLGGSREPITTFFPFPLLPGPFSAGYEGGARQDAVQNVHAVLAEDLDSCGGRLWDNSLSREDNLKIAWSDEAPEVFLECGLRPPFPSRKAAAAAASADSAAAEPEPAEEEEAPAAALVGSEATAEGPASDAPQETEPSPVVETPQVEDPGGSQPGPTGTEAANADQAKAELAREPESPRQDDAGRAKDPPPRKEPSKGGGPCLCCRRRQRAEERGQEAKAPPPKAAATPPAPAGPTPQAAAKGGDDGPAEPEDVEAGRSGGAGADGGRNVAKDENGGGATLGGKVIERDDGARECVRNGTPGVVIPL